jgi:hypothetical protein
MELVSEQMLEHLWELVLAHVRAQTLARSLVMPLARE